MSFKRLQETIKVNKQKDSLYPLPKNYCIVTKMDGYWVESDSDPMVSESWGPYVSVKNAHTMLKSLRQTNNN